MHNTNSLNSYEKIRKLKDSPITGDLESEKRGSGISLLGVRDYVDGDPFAAICWKKSTIENDFKVKEFEAEIARKVAFVLDERKQFHLGYGASQTWELAKLFTLKMIRSYLENNSSVSLITQKLPIKDLGGKQNFRLFEQALSSIKLAEEINEPDLNEVNFFDNCSSNICTFRSFDPFELCTHYLTPPSLTYIVAPYCESEIDQQFQKINMLKASRLDPTMCFLDIESVARQVKIRFGNFEEHLINSRINQKQISRLFAQHDINTVWIMPTNITGKMEIVRYGTK